MKERNTQTNKKEEVLGERGSENSTFFTAIDRKILRL
jgi:hypothetical protein